MKTNGPPKLDQFKSKNDFLHAMQAYVQEMVSFLESMGHSREEIVAMLTKIPGVVIVKTDSDD